VDSLERLKTNAEVIVALVDDARPGDHVWWVMLQDKIDAIAESSTNAQDTELDQSPPSE